MWHWPQVSGVRASSTEEACRAWQAVQVPISWHFRHPRFTATGPSRAAIAIGLRSTAPLWNCSEKAICSLVNSPGPATDAQAGAAWRLRRNWLYSVGWHCLQFAAVTFLAIVNPRWSIPSCPSTLRWHSRQLTPVALWRLISNSWTTAEVSRRWHSAHLPVARTRAAVGCAVSVFGLRALTMNAATTSAVPRKMVMKTPRNDIPTSVHLKAPATG